MELSFKVGAGAWTEMEHGNLEQAQVWNRGGNGNCICI